MDSVADLLFGKGNKSGILTKLYSEAIGENPLEWMKEMQAVIELVGPQSFLFQKMI